MENINIEKSILKELNNLEKDIEIEKLKACLNIIILNNEYNKDDENCLDIIKRVKNSKEDHSLVESVNFLERFWKYYSDKDLSEIDKCGLKARIKEGVTFLSKFNLEEQSELAGKIISDDKNNLGDVCRYLCCISMLDNINQVNTLERIVDDEKINVNSLELLAIPLVLKADNKDLSKLNDLLDFSYEMDNVEMKNNLKTLSRKK